MMALLRALVLLLALVPLPAAAQVAASLVADSLTVAADGRLVASGNVTAFHDGTTLSAAAIAYDPATDRLTITGPIFIRAADGTILTADRADLAPELETGLLLGARLVLDQRLQLAANRIDRIGGRYDALTEAAATACAVCGNRPPLWEIRAGRVIHDTAERQLYFQDARFLIRGVPVLWLPALRLPDPTLDRATGLLVPQVRTTDRLGLGVKLPFFLRLGDHADLTLTPYLSADTTTLEARYRQAFLRGEIEVRGAQSRDAILPGQQRGYVFAEGRFDLGRDYRLEFDVQTVSDPAYLLDYGYSDTDRLASRLTLGRYGERSRLLADLTLYQSLRETETDRTLPPVVAEIHWERRYSPALTGGVLTLTAGIESFVRTGDQIGPDGRDVSRAGASVDWRRDWVIGPGVLVEARGALAVDAYAIAGDPDWPDTALRATPAAAVTLRWPLAGTGPFGARSIVEPVAALIWTAPQGDAVPDEDGTLVEFDEGNFTDLTRFPGQDATEDGLTAALGLTWTRIAPSGVTTRLTFGRLVQNGAEGAASATSGLEGAMSDWLVAGQADLGLGLTVMARTLLADDLSPGKSEARIVWAGEGIDLAAAYVSLPADAAEARAADIAEWSFDLGWRLNDTWAIAADARYDLAADRPARAGLGVTWSNECVTVDVSVARRYTSSTTLEPATDFGLSVTLDGFSAGQGADRRVADCRD